MSPEEQIQSLKQQLDLSFIYVQRLHMGLDKVIIPMLSRLDRLERETFDLKIFTLKEAMDRTGLSASSIRRLVKSGKATRVSHGLYRLSGELQGTIPLVNTVEGYRTYDDLVADIKAYSSGLKEVSVPTP